MRIICCAACVLAVLMLAACGNQSQPAANQTAANSSPAINSGSRNTQTGGPAAAPAHATNPTASSSSSSSGGSGEAVDTSKDDAEIARLQKQVDKKGSATDRAALARAYLSRAETLTGARQYRAALGDYRRTLKYEPDNEEARKMVNTIVNILQSMGREVPAEGAEPSPLPYKKS